MSRVGEMMRGGADHEATVASLATVCPAHSKPSLLYLTSPSPHCAGSHSLASTLSSGAIFSNCFFLGLSCASGSLVKLPNKQGRNGACSRCWGGVDCEGRSMLPAREQGAASAHCMRWQQQQQAAALYPLLHHSSSLL